MNVLGNILKFFRAVFGVLLSSRRKARKQIVQEMQMCLKCSPFFDQEKYTLAHEIGMHVRVFPDGYTDLSGKRVEFMNEMAYRN